jgi:hypothetical protein
MRVRYEIGDLPRNIHQWGETLTEIEDTFREHGTLVDCNHGEAKYTVEYDDSIDGWELRGIVETQVLDLGHLGNVVYERVEGP